MRLPGCGRGQAARLRLPMVFFGSLWLWVNRWNDWENGNLTRCPKQPQYLGNVFAAQWFWKSGEISNARHAL